MTLAIIRAEYIKNRQTFFFIYIYTSGVPDDGQCNVMLYCQRVKEKNFLQNVTTHSLTTSECPFTFLLLIFAVLRTWKNTDYLPILCASVFGFYSKKNTMEYFLYYNAALLLVVRPP